MIERVQSFRVGDRFFNTFDEAQRAELSKVIEEIEPQKTQQLCEFIVNHKARIVDILTMTSRSRAKARAINGAKRKRKSLPKTITASETVA